MKIHDIKPIVEIPDNSIYLYYGLIILTILFVIVTIYFIYSFFKSKKDSQQKKYFRVLKNLNFNNQKETAYSISKYGDLIIKDERGAMLFDDLNNSLEEFKYRKEVSKTIPNNIKAQYDIFMETLNVK